MSLLIKGMRMPKNCDVCIFSDWSNLHQTAACKICEYDPCFDDFSKAYLSERAMFCPLIEVKTPHGRLIDADELMNESRKDEACGHVDTKHIYNAPTVIEAETNDDELKPCPFCNGSATIFHSNLIPHEYEVRCISCGSRTMTYKSCGKQAAKLNAIQAWNRRVNDE